MNEEKPEAQSSEHGPVLQAAALEKEYLLGSSTVHALRGVDFVIQSGEFVAIMGPSGSGKSTLLHLVGGLDTASSGEITLAGKQLSLLKDRELTMLRRKNVGFVFQFFNLIPTLTAEENIALPMIIDETSDRNPEERVGFLLDLIGLADRRDHKPDQLSGGEQQRIALARAMAHEPAIVLADEPTGNLDSNTGDAIMNLLRQSCDRLGQTIIIVTHDARAAAFADRIVFLQDGKIEHELSLEKCPDPLQKLKLINDVMLSLEDQLT